MSKAALLALASGLILASASAAAAQDSGPIDPARLSDITRELASDRFAGRAPGGEGETPAHPRRRAAQLRGHLRHVVARSRHPYRGRGHASSSSSEPPGRRLTAA